MDGSVFEKVVSSEQRLREVLGHPGERAVGKEQRRLDKHCRAFIAQSPFLILGTANAAGQCDVSPKGDEPGFIRVEDPRTLLIPERVGNNLAFGLSNILATGKIGLIALVPATGETLRV